MDYQFKTGHTAITWPGDQLEQAIADTAALGYSAFESFGWTLESWEKERPGEYKALLDKHGLAQYSAYCAANIARPDDEAAEIEKVVTWGKLLKNLGGSVATLGAQGRRQESYSLDDFKDMARITNEIGKQLLDIGIKCCFHQHTGTTVETEEEIYMFLNEVDPNLVFFGPDVGQIAKGGSDPVKIVRDFKSMIQHVHLKDFVGGEVEKDENGKDIDSTGYVCYLPLGEGVVDLLAILEILAEIDYDGYIMVELDGTSKAPYPPKEAAAISKRYLQSLGQKFLK